MHELLAQDKAPDTTMQKKLKTGFVAGASTVVLAGSIIFLNKISGYQYSKGFQTRNDNKAWLQMDKCTHAFAAYGSTRTLSKAYKWAGVPPQKSTLISSATSVVYTSTKEFLDGHQENGGWSWGDICANTFGTVLYASQDLVWEEQKIQYKI